MSWVVFDSALPGYAVDAAELLLELTLGRVEPIGGSR